MVVGGSSESESDWCVGVLVGGWVKKTLKNKKKPPEKRARPENGLFFLLPKSKEY